MKILFLTDAIPPRSVGGAAQSVWRAAQQLHKLGHKVFVVTTVQDKQFEGREDRNGIIIYNIFATYDDRWRAYVSIYNPSVVRVLDSIFKEISPDVIHADNIHFYISYAALPIARRHSKRLFLTMRDFMSVAYGKVEPRTQNCTGQIFKVHWWNNFKQAKKRYNPFRNILIRFFLKYVDQVFSNSKMLAEFLNANRIPGVVPIHNGLIVRDVSTSNEIMTAFRSEHKLDDYPIVLFPARVSAAKGSYIAIDAMRFVIKHVPNAVLVMVGVQERDREDLMRYAKSFDMDRSVRLIGWIPKESIDVVFNISDVVIIPSLYPDPFPTVNLDAALYHKPVVTTCIGGGSEFVVDGKTGYIENPFDAEAFGKKIVELLTNAQKAHALGEAAYERLISEFTVEKQVEKLLKWYEGDAMRPRKKKF